MTRAPAPRNDRHGHYDRRRFQSFGLDRALTKPVPITGGARPWPHGLAGHRLRPRLAHDGDAAWAAQALRLLGGGEDFISVKPAEM